MSLNNKTEKDSEYHDQTARTLADDITVCPINP